MRTYDSCFSCLRRARNVEMYAHMCIVCSVCIAYGSSSLGSRRLDDAGVESSPLRIRCSRCVLSIGLFISGDTAVRTARKRRCDRRHLSEFARDITFPPPLFNGNSWSRTEKLFKLNHYADLRTRSAHSPVWLRARCPHLREDYPLAVALYASAASLSAREECGKQLPRILRGCPFACMPFSRPHGATYDIQLSSPCVDVDTPLDPGQPCSRGKGIAAGAFRLRWIWHRYSPGTTI